MKMLSFLNLKELIKLKPDQYIERMSIVSKTLFVFFVTAIVPGICFLYLYNDGHFWENAGKYIQVVSSLAIFFSLYALYMQLCITRYHEQGRIELQKTNRAIELINKWNETLTPDVMFARAIVDKMSRKMAIKLFNKEEISIDKADYKTFCALIGVNGKIKKKHKHRKDLCPNIDRCSVSDKKPLDMIETIWLRSLVMRYLNSLEVIMYAWKADAINRDMIEKEFEYLVSSARDGTVVLKEFREAAGQENFPGIYSFCEYISEKQKKEIIPQEISG